MQKDPNACFHLTDGVLLLHGTRYEMDFTEKE